MRGCLTLLVLLGAGSAFAAEQAALAATVRPITTTLVYPDGSYQKNRGTGFVVKNQFLTAAHNIQGNERSVKRVIELAGHRVEPAAVQVELDLAMFELPPELCERWCNSRELAEPAAPSEVIWIQAFDDAGYGHLWRTAQITSVAFKSNTPIASACARNVVMEIETPFYPGSSGGPVFDAHSGAIVGLIQGSFERRNGASTGYFKPVECVREWLANSL